VGVHIDLEILVIYHSGVYPRSAIHYPESHECLTEQSTSQAVYAGGTSVYNSLHC